MSKKENTSETKYAIEQILKSKKYTAVEKDIIRAKAIEKEYSLDEINVIINNFKKGKVK